MPFPAMPATPKYQYVAPAEHKQRLVGQIKQFEGEMANHFSNLNRLKALYDAAPADPSGDQLRQEAQDAANQAIRAITTIEAAITATTTEHNAL